MSTFVALLRGVNVGKAKRVPMAELRALLSGLGYTGVATLLNSGNAVFGATRGTPAKHAKNIADAISTQLKVDVSVIVKSASELAFILAENPIKARVDEYPRLLVAFVQDTEALSSLVAIKSLVVPPEKYAVGKNAAYLLCAAGILEAKPGELCLARRASRPPRETGQPFSSYRLWQMNATPNPAFNRTRLRRAG